jgi:hypothetical protein
MLCCDVIDVPHYVCHVQVTGRRLLQQQLHMSPTARRNRLTTQRSNTAAADFASLRPLLQHQSSHEQIHQQNTLMSAAAGATSLPVFGRQLSQHSQRRHMLQQQHPSNITGTLQDTLCLVPPSNWPFELPPDIGLIGCDDPKQRPYLAGFQPVELPVVFHCKWGNLLQAKCCQLLAPFELCYIVGVCAIMLGLLPTHAAPHLHVTFFPPLN